MWFSHVTQDLSLCTLNKLCCLSLFTSSLSLLCYVCDRNAIWKQRELIALLRNPEESAERGPPGVVMETDAGSFSGAFLLTSAETETTSCACVFDETHISMQALIHHCMFSRLHHTRGLTPGRRSCWESASVLEPLVSPLMTITPRRVYSSSRPATACSTVRTEATMASSWVKKIAVLVLAS